MGVRLMLCSLHRFYKEYPGRLCLLIPAIRRNNNIPDRNLEDNRI